MLTQIGMLLVCLLVCAGCAATADKHAVGYGDYLAMSCDQLGQEVSRLKSQAGQRNEPSFDNRQDARETTALRLNEVKQARTEKHCAAENL